MLSTDAHRSLHPAEPWRHACPDQPRAGKCNSSKQDAQRTGTGAQPFFDEKRWKQISFDEPQQGSRPAVAGLTANNQLDQQGNATYGKCKQTTCNLHNRKIKSQLQGQEEQVLTSRAYRGRLDPVLDNLQAANVLTALDAANQQHLARAAVARSQGQKTRPKTPMKQPSDASRRWARSRRCPTAKPCST